MKPSNDLAELLEVDRPMQVSVDVLPQAELRSVDHFWVGERRGHTEALGDQPSRQCDLA
jgi:hypothetical protein